MTARIAGAQTGQTFAGPAKHMSLARLLAFSGGPFDAPDWPEKNLHTDAEMAADAGLAAIIASGTQFEGYVLSLLVELFDDAWFHHGVIESRIRKSVAVGDTVRAKATLRESQPDGDAIAYLLDIWCENQDGDKVLVGTASCRL
jgi:acyl dehydratase